MRLINVDTLLLEEFFGEIPPYAILSHTWEVDEVTFQDIHYPAIARSKSGFAKIVHSCARASKDGLRYCWIDTCCIDKSSSAELSEAINSMFQWYRNSKVCYVYLSKKIVSKDKCQHESHWEWFATQFDETGHTHSGCSASHLTPSEEEAFLWCRWWGRGWTLQELIAPLNQIFFDYDWKVVGGKYALIDAITKASSIDRRVFQGASMEKFSVAQRFSWAAARSTTRIEDEAYSLMGIFDINMPLLYGEGRKAFLRLQEEIIKRSSDHSIFAWLPMVDRDRNELLAPHASRFKHAGNIMRRFGHSKERNFELGNNGLRVSLPVVQRDESYNDLIVFDCAYEDNYQSWESISIAAVRSNNLLSQGNANRYVLLRAGPEFTRHSMVACRPEDTVLIDVLLLRNWQELRRIRP